MKYQETYLGSRADFSEFVKRAIPELFTGKLIIEGKPVTLPTDRDLDYKIKYDDNEDGGSVSIKVTWENQEDVEINIDD